MASCGRKQKQMGERKNERMKKIKQLAAIAVGFMCLGGVAKADLIDLGLRSLTGVLGSPTAEASFIETDQSLSYNLTYLNKFEYGSGWTGGGAVSSSYFTITPNSGETANATISWDLTGSGYLLHYVLLKNGRSGAFHLYHLYGVTADQYLIGGGDVTINGEKGISHIAFYGVQGTTSVPEGGTTLALLGLGLVGLGAGRRFMEC
jgi:hypothetical protein